MEPPRPASALDKHITERKVDGYPDKNLPPYHAPRPDPDDRLSEAQFAGAQLLSDALVRSFLRVRSKEVRNSLLLSLPPWIKQWCQEQQKPFSNFEPVPQTALTCALEWAYDRAVSRLLFDNNYVRKLPVNDPNALRYYLQATMRNDLRNLARRCDESLRHDDTRDGEARPDAVSEEYAAPIRGEQSALLLKESLDHLCDLLRLPQKIGAILLSYFGYHESEEAIKARFGITLGAALKRVARAIKQHPAGAAKAKACLQECLTEMQRTMAPERRSILAQQDDKGKEKAAAGAAAR
jgi:hypothetical protein